MLSEGVLSFVDTGNGLPLLWGIANYRRHVNVFSTYIDSIENLQTVGRNGMHRYNNQDHSMLTALLAARIVLGEEHDLWNVNVDCSYHEDFVIDKNSSKNTPAGGGAD
jgi:hypothetical protein